MFLFPDALLQIESKFFSLKWEREQTHQTFYILRFWQELPNYISKLKQVHLLSIEIYQTFTAMEIK
jgi:hypothetical protein